MPASGEASLRINLAFFKANDGVPPTVLLPILHKQKAGERPGLYSQLRTVSPALPPTQEARESGDLKVFQGLLEGILHRLPHFGRSLGGQRLEFLGLLDGHFDALADEGGLQFDQFRK
jgi:hypothetical protein